MRRGLLPFGVAIVLLGLGLVDDGEAEVGPFLNGQLYDAAPDLGGRDVAAPGLLDGHGARRARDASGRGQPIPVAARQVIERRLLRGADERVGEQDGQRQDEPFHTGVQCPDS